MLQVVEGVFPSTRWVSGGNDDLVNEEHPLTDIRQCRMIFIETSLFTKLLPNYLTDEEYCGLQVYLLRTPDGGDLIRGSGGVRKVRWAISGSGKSSGVRVIYFWKKSDHQIWLLTIYQKSEQDSIPGHTLKQIAEALKNE